MIRFADDEICNIIFNDHFDFFIKGEGRVKGPINIRNGKIVIAIAAGLSGPALAETETGQLTLNATVLASCAIDNATLDFGNMTTSLTGGSASDVEGTSTVTVVCTSGTSATVSANGGSNYLSGRRMLRSGSTGDYLTYELYTSSQRDTVWNDTNKLFYTGTGEAESLSLYGRVTRTAVDSAEPGSYSDTVVMTIEYTP